jgi:hypothetical protein
MIHYLPLALQAHTRKLVQQYPRGIQEDQIRHQHRDYERPRGFEHGDLTHILGKENRRRDFQLPILNIIHLVRRVSRFSYEERCLPPPYW